MNRASQQGVSEDVQVFAIKVEKLLCSKLGIEWTPALENSIANLVDQLASPPPSTHPQETQP